MRVIVERLELAAALATCSRIATARHSLPILGNVRLEADAAGEVTLSATDLELAARVQLAVVAADGGPGAMIFPALEALEAIKGRAGSATVTLESTGDSEEPMVRLEAGPVRLELPGADPEEYPSIPVPVLEAHTLGDATAMPRGCLEVPALRSLLEVTHASSTDETRFNLNGCYLEGFGPGQLRLTATDGHRLATTTAPGSWPLGLEAESGEDREGAILPRSFCLELARLVKPRGASGTVLVWCDGQMALARFGSVVLASRLIDGKYPDYRQVVPDPVNHYMAHVEPRAVASSLKRVAKASGKTRIVKVTVNGELLLEAGRPGDKHALEALPVEYDGPEVTLGVNAVYLREALEALGTDRVTVRLAEGVTVPTGGKDAGKTLANASLNPLRLEAIGSPMVAVVMPARL